MNYPTDAQKLAWSGMRDVQCVGAGLILIDWCPLLIVAAVFWAALG